MAGEPKTFIECERLAMNAMLESASVRFGPIGSVSDFGNGYTTICTGGKVGSKKFSNHDGDPTQRCIAGVFRKFVDEISSYIGDAKEISVRTSPQFSFGSAPDGSIRIEARCRLDKR